jgi:hypothetical protein
MGPSELVAELSTMPSTRTPAEAAGSSAKGLDVSIVLREGRLLHRHFHGVAVERSLIRIAVLQVAGRQFAHRDRDMRRLRHTHG